MAELTTCRNDVLGYPVYGMPYVVAFPILDVDGDPVTGLTPDTEISKNGDTAVDSGTEAAEIAFDTATNKGMYYLYLSAAEMTCNMAAITVYTGSADAQATPIVLYPKKLPLLASGTAGADGNDATHIDLHGKSAVDDFYIGCIVFLKDHTGANQVRMITDYVGSTQLATVDPGFVVNPDNTTDYEIYLTDVAVTTLIASSIATGGIAAASFAAGAIDAAAIANAAIDNATFAADVGSTAYATNIIALAADKAVIQNNLDHLALTATVAADMTAEVADNTILSRILGNGDTSTFVPSTDGLHTAGVDIDAILADTNELQVDDYPTSIAAVKADTAAILVDTGTTLDGRIPAALVGGRMDASVGAMAAGVVTAAAVATGAIDADAIADNAIDAGAIATGAITAAKFAAGAIDAAAIANAAIDAATFAAGAIDAGALADGAIDAAAFAAGAINAAAIADNAIDFAAFAADCKTGAGLKANVESITANAITAASMNADASAEVADAVWDEARAGHVGVGTFGEVSTKDDIVDAVWDELLVGHAGAGTAGAALSAASSAGDPWSTLIPGAYGAGTAGKILGDNINAPIGTVDTVVDAISGRLPAALVSGRIDASVGAMANNVVTAAAIATGAIDADAIADNAIDAGAIAADAITAAKIADSAIDIATFAADCKTGSNLNAQVKAQDNIDFGALQKASLNAATPASVAGSVGSVAGAVGSVTGNVGGNVVGSVGSVTGAVGSVTGNVGGSVASIAAGGITAGSIGADAIGASELAADAVAEIADQVWDELLAGHAGAGSAGAGLTAAGSAGDPWSTPLPGAYGAGTAGKLIGDNINAPVGTVDTVVDGIATMLTDVHGTDLPAVKTDTAAIKVAVDDIHATDLPAVKSDTAGIAALNDLSSAEVETAVSNQLNAAIPEPANISATKSIRNILYWLRCRFFNRNNQTATQQKTFKDDAITALATRTCSDDGTTQELGAGA